MPPRLLVTRGPRWAAMSVALLALTMASLLPAEAKGRPLAHVRSVAVTFRLHVAGQIAAGTTYWVSYGPLAGQWGIVRLRRTGPGRYEAAASIPATGRTIFSYLAGRGTLRTPAGLVPGDPVITIQRFGPMSASDLPQTAVEWRPPVG